MKALRFDNTQAVREGWMLNQRSDGPPFAIETLDDPADHEGSTGFSFRSDQEAYVHVARCATGGSAYHISALAFLRQWSSDAFGWVVLAAGSAGAGNFLREMENVGIC